MKTRITWALVGMILGALLVYNFPPAAMFAQKAQQFALRLPPSPAMREALLAPGSLQPPSKFKQVTIPTYAQPADVVESFVKWFYYHDTLVWDDYFAASDIPAGEPALHILVGEQTDQSVCQSVTGSDDAFFCNADNDATHQGAIWVKISSLVEYWDRPDIGGPYQVEAIIDHEYGHFVQWWLQHHVVIGILPNVPHPNDELIASCFGGNVGNVWYQENRTYLLDGVLAGLHEKTDKLHGTAAQQRRAYATGYTHGAPADCINSYWPGIHA